MNEKRRLPSWIVGASTTNKASKPLDVDANKAITKKETSVVTESKNPKAKGVTRKHKKEDSFPGEKNFLVKCETKRKKRGGVESHDSEQEVVRERKKRGRVRRKGEEPDPLKKKKEKSYKFERNNENQDPIHDDEDDDLTMDDVLSIAKEIVDNDKSDKGLQKPIEGEGGLKVNSLSSYTSSSVTKASLIAPQEETRSPVHEENASHNLIESTSKDTSEEFRMTGDPAQDMLDLFLGPLLKKPIAKEEASSTNDHILLPREIKKQKHVISDNPVTMLKKKSSLRDAVAMLLD